MPSDTGKTVTRRRARGVVRYLLVFVGCVLIVDALVGEKGLLAMLKARDTYTRLEKSLSEAREENARLREAARRLREDPLTIEEIARRELGLIGPGEKLFIIRDVPPSHPQRRD
ncbi:MAG: septum formation initiator family protein [Acidobacteria bacterium]|nr:septum formation initiator family protein [Acidobacteriota bacterium]